MLNAVKHRLRNLVAMHVVLGDLRHCPIHSQVILPRGNNQVHFLEQAIAIHSVVVEQRAARRFAHAHAAELAAKGANESLIHVDWMIGSGELDIDGVTATGAVEPLMRKGEWV